MSPAPCPAIRARSRASASAPASRPACATSAQRMQAGMIVVPQALGIEIDDLLQPRQAPGDLQHLVDLLLVARHHEARPAVLEHMRHLLGHRVLVERHRHRPASLRRHHRPVEMRPVAPDDREVVARPEPQRLEARRPAPAPRPRSRPRSSSARCRTPSRDRPASLEVARVPGEQLGKRVEVRGGVRRLHRSSSPRAASVSPPARRGGA